MIAIANAPATNVIAIADKGSHGGILMWPSRELSSTVYDIANIGLIVGLVVGVVSTALIVWMGNVKEEYLKRDIADATARASEANAKYRPS